MKTCKKCGGTRRADGRCLVCELLAAGSCYDGVPACRGNKPQASQALKVNRKNIPGAVAAARRHGVPTEFTPDGKPQFTSRRHKAQYLRMLNRDQSVEEQMYNADGVYGDE